jgi:hypothetical protein
MRSQEFWPMSSKFGQRTGVGLVERVEGTGDARKHAHALELSDSGKSISSYLHAIIALICMRLIPHRHGENRRSVINISPLQPQNPTASSFQATRQRHFKKPCMWTTEGDIVEQDWDAAISPNIRRSSPFWAPVTLYIWLIGSKMEASWGHSSITACLVASSLL